MIIAGNFFIVCNIVLMNYDDFCYDLEYRQSIYMAIIFFLFHCLILVLLFNLIGIF